MKGKKNDFSMSFFYQGNRVLYLHYVHNTDSAIRWVTAKNIKFDAYAIFDRRNGGTVQTFQNQYYKHNNSPYSITLYLDNNRVFHLQSVDNVHYAIDWCIQKGKVFDRVRVYDCSTREIIEEFYI